MPGPVSQSYGGPDDRNVAPEIAKMQDETNRLELIGAIRAFTVETGDQPNGRAERAWLRLQQALRPRLFGTGAAEASAAAAELAEAMADDVRRLRIAAEAYFGGDFRKP